MCIESLGPSIADLLSFVQGTFSVKTTLMIGRRMLSVLEQLHNNGIVHLDIKPANIVIGTLQKTKEIYLIDFGISTLYVNRQTGQHIKYGYTGKFLGTARYASVNAHALLRLSRKDDLESLAYMLLHLCSEQGLPWSPR